MKNEPDKMYIGRSGSGMSRSNICDLLNKFADEKVAIIDPKSELQKEKREEFYDCKN